MTILTNTIDSYITYAKLCEKIGFKVILMLDYLSKS